MNVVRPDVNMEEAPVFTFFEGLQSDRGRVLTLRDQVCPGVLRGRDVEGSLLPSSGLGAHGSCSVKFVLQLTWG